MNRKGFPESYDRRALLRLRLRDEGRSGQDGESRRLAPGLRHPAWRDADRAPARHPHRGGHQRASAASARRLALADFFDFSLYVDARVEHIRSWYLNRFLELRCTAFEDPRSYFHAMATSASEEEAKEFAMTPGTPSTRSTWWRTSSPPGRARPWSSSKEEDDRVRRVRFAEDLKSGVFGRCPAGPRSPRTGRQGRRAGRGQGPGDRGARFRPDAPEIVASVSSR